MEQLLPNKLLRLASHIKMAALSQFIFVPYKKGKPYIGYLNVFQEAYKEKDDPEIASVAKNLEEKHLKKKNNKPIGFIFVGGKILQLNKSINDLEKEGAVIRPKFHITSETLSEKDLLKHVDMGENKKFTYTGIFGRQKIYEAPKSFDDIKFEAQPKISPTKPEELPEEPIISPSQEPAQLEKNQTLEGVLGKLYNLLKSNPQKLEEVRSAPIFLSSEEESVFDDVLGQLQFYKSFPEKIENSDLESFLEITNIEDLNKVLEATEEILGLELQYDIPTEIIDFIRKQALKLRNYIIPKLQYDESSPGEDLEEPEEDLEEPDEDLEEPEEEYLPNIKAEAIMEKAQEGKETLIAHLQNLAEDPVYQIFLQILEQRLSEKRLEATGQYLGLIEKEINGILQKVENLSPEEKSIFDKQVPINHLIYVFYLEDIITGYLKETLGKIYNSEKAEVTLGNLESIPVVNQLILQIGTLIRLIKTLKVEAISGKSQEEILKKLEEIKGKLSIKIGTLLGLSLPEK